MNTKLEAALTNVEITYQELIEISNEMTMNTFGPINELVNNLSNSVNALSIDQIRDYILQLQLKAFEISEIKEKSTLKAELAEALQKEALAIKFNSLDGSAAAKEKLALVAVSAEILTDTLYNLVANLYKGKVDQLHRLVAALQSILTSRTQEQRFMQIGSDSEVARTTNGKVILNEHYK